MLNQNEYKYNDTSVIKLVKDIEESHLLMPSIQREFVWKKEKIEKLFDSLMKKYPITTFLFWPIKNENKSRFDFYDFLNEYHNTDDPTICNTNLKDELKLVANAFNLTYEDIIKLQLNAINASFASKEVKEEVIKLLIND